MDKIVAIRGATTIKTNTIEDISKETLRLISEILDANALSNHAIVSCIVGSTVDIDAYYPATAINMSGILKNVPLFSTLEPNINGSLPLCIRVILTVMCTKEFKALHIYLNEAANLKPNTD